MLSMEETVQLIQTQQQDIESLTNRNKELEDIIAVLQNKIASFSVQGAKNEKQNAVNVDTSNINMQLNLNRPMPPPLLPVEQQPEKPKSEPDITFAL